MRYVPGSHPGPSSTIARDDPRITALSASGVRPGERAVPLPAGGAVMPTPHMHSAGPNRNPTPLAAYILSSRASAAIPPSWVTPEFRRTAAKTHLGLGKSRGDAGSRGPARAASRGADFLRGAPARRAVAALRLFARGFSHLPSHDTPRQYHRISRSTGQDGRG
jgi:hypothetical protein